MYFTTLYLLFKLFATKIPSAKQLAEGMIGFIKLMALIATCGAVRKSRKYIHIKDKTINLLNNPF